MKVTLEQIDELRSRVNVSYEEAKKTLEKNDGDLIKSIIELENKKVKKEVKKDGFKEFVNKLLELKLSVNNKNGDTILNIPVVIVLITFIMAFWIVIFGLLLAVLTSCKIKVYRDKNAINVNEIKKNMQETVDKIKVKSEKIINDNEEINIYEVKTVKDNTEIDDGENEITIE